MPIQVFVFFVVALLCLMHIATAAFHYARTQRSFFWAITPLSTFIIALFMIFGCVYSALYILDNAKPDLVSNINMCARNQLYRLYDGGYVNAAEKEQLKIKIEEWQKEALQRAAKTEKQ